MKLLAGSWPMAKNSPDTGTSLTSPVFTLLPAHAPSMAFSLPVDFSTTLLHKTCSRSHRPSEGPMSPKARRYRLQTPSSIPGQVHTCLGLICPCGRLQVSTARSEWGRLRGICLCMPTALHMHPHATCGQLLVRVHEPQICSVIK